MHHRTAWSAAQAHCCARLQSDVRGAREANHSPDLAYGGRDRALCPQLFEFAMTQPGWAAFQSRAHAPGIEQSTMRDNSGKAGRRIMRRKATAFGAAVACAGTSRSVLGCVRPGASGLPQRSALASRLSTLCALGCAMAVSGCAPGSVQSEVKPDPMHAAAAPTLTNSEVQMCRPDRALFAPQPAPDCGFGRSKLRTLDPEQWAYLKLEYERRCYKNAEKVARERLRRLQAATRCEVDSARL